MPMSCAIRQNSITDTINLNELPRKSVSAYRHVGLVRSTGTHDDISWISFWFQCFTLIIDMILNPAFKQLRISTDCCHIITFVLSELVRDVPLIFLRDPDMVTKLTHRFNRSGPSHIYSPNYWTNLCWIRKHPFFFFNVKEFHALSSVDFANI